MGISIARTTWGGLGLEARRAVWAYAFLAGPLAFYVVIRIFPAASALFISLHRWNIVSAERPFVGAANFREILSDPLFWKAVTNTLRYLIAGIPAQLILGLGIALLLRRITRFRGFFRALYFIPFVTPIVAAAWVWQWMYTPTFGPLNRLFEAAGLPRQAFLRQPHQALYAIAAMVVWEYVGFQVVIFLAGLEAIPQVFYEAAEVDGAGGWGLFRHITVPLLNPTLVFSAVYGTILYLQLFTQVLNMTFGDQGGPLGSTMTIVLYVYIQGFQRFRMGPAAAATVVLFVAILAITLLQLRFFSRQVEY
ncbi:MAG TPA: sugar ABC transporter permease [bacterium]|nr:sugar ABC transporter permease [bacterium]